MRVPRRVLVLFVITALVLAAAVIAAAAITRDTGGGVNPDLPVFAKQTEADNADYLQLRAEYEARLRGIEPGLPFNPNWRTSAVKLRQQQETQREGVTPHPPTPAWIEIGPDSLPNGQTQQFPATAAVSGRVTAIAVDPGNGQTAYLGTAQGGVWRTTDGGTSWTPIFDNAQSLSIGALALAPSDTTKLYVGTGEPNNSADSFFGVGVYRIDNAGTSATLVGPINPPMTYNIGTTTAFGGRSISRILVSPSDPATIFVSTATGVGGMGGNAVSNTVPPLALRGVYRSTNATAAAASVAFTKLVVNTDGSLDTPATGNTSIFDMAFVNNDPNILLAAPSGASTGGGVWRSTNALAATPIFTNTLFPSFNGLVMKLGVSGNNVVVTSNEPAAFPATGSGRVRLSTTGGATWSTPLLAADGFCGSQCGYDNPVGVDPTTSGGTLRIYIGGNARGTFSDVLKQSNDAGTSWTRDDTGLHADAHAIVFDSAGNVWFGNDGGVWKRNAGSAAATAWTNLNNGLGTLQFQSVAVGKSDAFFAMGGTQDNGTEMMKTSLGNWTSAESGDGGYALIDQSTTSTSTVYAYHTFFNQRNNLIGFDRTSNQTTCPKDGWAFRGAGVVADPTPSCDGTAFAAANGLGLSDFVEFYAPMALGPGTPNSVYFGTDRLYRDGATQGDAMAVVSQAPIVASTPITTIGISPTNDNVRIVGLHNGQVWATTTGSSTLTQMTGLTAPANATASATNKWVGRAVIDPNDPNTAYVTFSYYTNPSTDAHVWKTTNLNAGTPTWTAAASGIPNVPVNAFVVDPQNSQHLYAGTDVGVYGSTDGGATWAPYGTGLPEVAVFDMAIVQPGTASEKLRVATHGRSMWQIAVASNPTVISVASFGARRTGPDVQLSWRTASETSIAGFNVWRNGAKLNRALIPAKHAGLARGATYRFVDGRAARAHRYTYRLQVVDLRGGRTWYGSTGGVR